jgi:hypothetical protein
MLLAAWDEFLRIVRPVPEGVSGAGVFEAADSLGSLLLIRCEV